MTEIDADPWIGIVLNGIELVELTGTGATARVYRGVHRVLGERRAVKVFLDELEGDPAAKERFVREAKAVRSIAHPNVVELLDAGHTTDGQGFLVLEWLEGVTLDRLIAANAPIPPRRTARVMRQLLGALAAAHKAGLIHRDLKPSNVMIAEDPEASSEVVKLIDFGLVRVQDSKLTGAGRWLGTPAYVAPEVRLGDPPSAKSDLYALGAIAYEMLSGALPFGDQPEAAPRVGPPKALPTSSGLEPLVYALLESDPSRRPDDANAAMRLLDEVDFSTGGDLDTLIQPTDLDEADEVASTATDPGRSRRAPSVLRIERPEHPATRIIRRRRNVLLLGSIIAIALAAFLLGRGIGR